jgi:hypothetical protein
MASIKSLKKDLNYLSYELITEVFTFRHFHPDMKEEKFDEVIRNLVKTRNEVLSQINYSGPFEDRAARNLHYRKIREGMIKLVELVEELDK